MPPATLVSPPDLARTYDARAYSDPWEIVEDYQRVLEYTGRKPNVGSQHAASALDLPRGRIRPWMEEGAIPRPVRGIQRVERREWVPLTEESDHFDTINKLVAWACSRGTIKPETYEPYFMVYSGGDEERATALLESLDLEVAIHRDEDTRSTELRPREDGAVLGRLLAVLGAPVDDTTTDGVPWYLDEVSKDSQHEFARTYIENRGTHWEWNDRWVVEHQNRSEYYRRSLGTFFATLGADTEVHEDSISIDNKFVSELLEVE